MREVLMDITRHRNIRWLNLYINLDGMHDIHVMLEDSKRKIYD